MNKMLEYQKLDTELFKLKKSNSNNQDRANMSKLRNYIVEFQNKGVQLESNANGLVKEYNQLKKQYESNFKNVQDLTSKDINSVPLEKVDEFLSSINSLSSELFLLERNLNIIITKIKTILKDFETTKNNIIKAKSKYNEFKGKYESGVSEIEPQIKELESKLKAMEKDLPPDLFAKYKTIKSDKIFPVFVSCDGGHCSGCRVELPTAKINKLKDGTIICEQCHRIIFSK